MGWRARENPTRAPFIMRQHGKVEIENEAPFVCHACGGTGIAGFVEGEYLRTCRNKMQVERGIS
jgi:hypothetical protein